MWKENKSKNQQTAKSQSHSNYVANRESVKERATKRMLTDKTLRIRNLQRVKSHIENDATYKHRNKIKAAESSCKKLLNADFRELRKEYKRDKMKTAYHTQTSYRKTKKRTSRQPYRQCKNRNKSSLVQEPLQETKTQTKATKTYWARRTKLIAAVKENRRIAILQQKMSSTSGVPLLDTKLLMKKAGQRLKCGRKMVTHLHLNLVSKATYCLEHLPADRTPTEDELTSAFSGHRMHTSSSEPYFWQQCYNVYPPARTITIDCAGKAHIFKPVPVETELSSETTSTDKQTSTDVSRWECDSSTARSYTWC